MLRLYHAGFQVIPSPDVRYGRKNADFGQGFYLTADKAFAQKWAREQKGWRTYINRYELDPDGLSVLRLARGAEWFDYLSRNRAGKPDSLKDYDVITGPVAPDILYDTQGILTSGLLRREHALRLLLLGPEYDQTVLKTEKAAARLSGSFRRDAFETAGRRLIPCAPYVCPAGRNRPAGQLFIFSIRVRAQSSCAPSPASSRLSFTICFASRMEKSSSACTAGAFVWLPSRMVSHAQKGSSSMSSWTRP